MTIEGSAKIFGNFLRETVRDTELKDRLLNDRKSRRKRDQSLLEGHRLRKSIHGRLGLGIVVNKPVNTALEILEFLKRYIEHAENCALKHQSQSGETPKYLYNSEDEYTAAEEFGDYISTLDNKENLLSEVAYAAEADRIAILDKDSHKNILAGIGVEDINNCNQETINVLKFLSEYIDLVISLFKRKAKLPQLALSREQNEIFQDRIKQSLINACKSTNTSFLRPHRVNYNRTQLSFTNKDFGIKRAVYQYDNENHPLHMKVELINPIIISGKRKNSIIFEERDFKSADLQDLSQALRTRVQDELEKIKAKETKGKAQEPKIADDRPKPTTEKPWWKFWG